MKLDRQQIIKLLQESHNSFVSQIEGLTNDEFLSSYQQKWTAGQQLEHILLSISRVVLAFRLPKVLVRTAFGKANRTSKTYDELVAKYRDKLEKGGKSPKPFIPKAIAPNQKEKIIKALNNKVRILSLKIESLTEQELDAFVLPHPLLGKVTMREMLYFTIYHIGHHHEAVKRNLAFLEAAASR